MSRREKRIFGVLMCMCLLTSLMFTTNHMTTGALCCSCVAVTYLLMDWLIAREDWLWFAVASLLIEGIICLFGCLGLWAFAVLSFVALMLVCLYLWIFGGDSLSQGLENN